MSSHVFCRELCLKRHEPLAGTGKVAARSLLLHWPRGKWRVPRHESAGMGDRLRAALKNAMDAGIHVGLVDDGNARDGDGFLLQLYPQRVRLACMTEAELVDQISAFLAGEKIGGEAEPRISVLCCTDSRRDACCARFGFATFKALKKHADPARFQVFQCTHVGGCRFAASLMVLPQRQRYGRLSPEEVPAFLEAIGEGRVYLPAYRGRPDAPEPFQVAEIAALDWADRHGIDRRQVRIDLPDANEAFRPGDRMTLIAQAGDARLAIDLATVSYPVQTRCNSAVKDEDNHSTRWRVSGITPCSEERRSYAGNDESASLQADTGLTS
ncbi:sucrase ferredoxin [Paracoccus methylarcula]|uniref:Sucrase ferredoxin n=1 Tax=Paracoccus methylarcula TaxID=72022 RepID=A0A422QZE5_9RHOB|nr:sucrase ferredoxin [Paracoccus methylarcula]RNF35273.1 sucrase ferredoxin [Paracoccus methylarcula]